MDKMKPILSAGKIQRPTRESSELDLSGFSNDSLVAVVEAGVRERHFLEARFRNLCDVITQLGVNGRASRASRNKENDDNKSSRTREKSLRPEKCQSLQGHGSGWEHALSASSASPDIGNWPSCQTGPEKRKVRLRFRPSSASVVPKMVQESGMLHGIEGRCAVSDGGDEQGIMRRVGSTRRQRFDEPASEQRETNRFSSGRTRGETAAEASHADVSVSDVASEKWRPHGLAPFVSVNVNIGNVKASPVGQGPSSARESSGRQQGEASASGVSGANVKWDDNVQRGDTPVNLGTGFDTQPGGCCYRPLGGEYTRGAEHSFARNEERGSKVEGTGKARRVIAPGREHGVEEFDSVNRDCGNGRFTSSRPEDALPYRLEEHYGSNTGFARDVQCASKAHVDNQGNDDKWRQRGRVLWTMNREAAPREGADISRTLRPFESSDKQDISKRRLWSYGGQPYYGLYARSLRANGLDPERFRSSCCSHHPCQGAAGIDTAVSEREARYDTYRPQADKPIFESDSAAEDALAAERESAPTRGLQDKMEAGRIWSSFNQRAELLGTMPPTPLRTKATWMAKSGNAQYSVLEGSKGLLHSFWSSRPPRSTSIRAEQANLRSCCYAFGAGRQGQPPFPAAATHLMVATKNAWNAPRGAGADQPCERVKATDTARCGNLWGQPQRCYLSRNGDRYPGQRWAEATESGCSSCPHRGLATKGRNWT